MVEAGHLAKLVKEPKDYPQRDQHTRMRDQTSTNHLTNERTEVGSHRVHTILQVDIQVLTVLGELNHPKYQ